MSNKELYEETKSVYEELKGKEFPYTFEDMENIKYIALQSTKFSEDFLAEAIYLADMGYKHYGNEAWASFKPDNKDCDYKQNWKTHITIDSIESYYRSMQVLLPELKRLNIDHKIINPDWFSGQQNSSVQKGKCLAIYESDLTFVQDLNDEAKAFIMETPSFNIPTDHQMGGRLCGRYTNSRYDLGINHETGELEKISRENKDTFVFDPKSPNKTYYRPSFIPDPPSLDELLTMPREIKGDYQPHRESLKFYLARSGNNNELLMEMLKSPIKEFVKNHSNDPWFQKEIDYDFMPNLKETNYEGKTVLEVAMENGNDKIVEFLGGSVQKEDDKINNFTSIELPEEDKVSVFFEKAANLSDQEMSEIISKRLIKEEALNQCSDMQKTLLVGTFLYESLMSENKKENAIETFIEDFSIKSNEPKEKLLKTFQLGLRKEKAFYNVDAMKNGFNLEKNNHMNFLDEKIKRTSNLLKQVENNKGIDL